MILTNKRRTTEIFKSLVTTIIIVALVVAVSSLEVQESTYKIEGINIVTKGKEQIVFRPPNLLGLSITGSIIFICSYITLRRLNVDKR
jgi:hypothetical protein